MIWYLRQDNTTTVDGLDTLLTLLENDRYVDKFAMQVTHLGLQLDKPHTSVLDSTANERQQIKDVLNSYTTEDSLETTLS